MVCKEDGGLPAGVELLIIGAGIVGASTAFWAARAGLSPVVLEALPAPAALTTPVATGAFRLQFDNLEETELVRESVDLILDFSGITGQDSGPLGVRQPGYIWATTSEERAEAQRRLVALQHSWGQTDIELLTGDEAHRRFPYLSPEVVQARYRAGDGFVDPRALTLGLLRASGVPLHTSCRVVSLRDRPSGGFDVGTDQGSHPGRAGGDRRRTLLREAGRSRRGGPAAGGEAAPQGGGSRPGPGAARRPDDHR